MEFFQEITLEVTLEVSPGDLPRDSTGTGHCLSDWSLEKRLPHLVLELEHGVLLGEGPPVLPLDDGGQVRLVVVVLVLQLKHRWGGGMAEPSMRNESVITDTFVTLFD